MTDLPTRSGPVYTVGQRLYSPTTQLRGTVLPLDNAGTAAIWDERAHAWMYTLHMTDGLFETMRFPQSALLPDNRQEPLPL